MRELTVGANDVGRRLDRFLAASFPHLPVSLLQRWIREKKVRLRGKHLPPDTRLEQGDTVALYVDHATLDRPDETQSFLRIQQPKLDIVYEDEHILLVNKPAGLSVHADEHEQVHTLIGHIQSYLYQAGVWRPQEENSFAPSLAHRLDRNTSGLVLAAKTAPALRLLNEKMAAREIEKRYLCLVVGQLQPKSGQLSHILRRDLKRKQVSVYDHPVPDGRTAVLRYRTIAVREGCSLLDIELLTGRTHQIRAQLAHIGHPLVGDGKYGKPDAAFRGQALCAYKLAFRFIGPSQPLDYLNGKEFSIDPPFSVSPP